MSPKQSKTDTAESSLLEVLEKRFRGNMHRHPNVNWDEVSSQLNSEKISVLNKMEESGGEPDVVDFDDGKITFCDCSTESPKGRRSFCYDAAALKARKENKPKNSAEEYAEEIGIKILTEDQYRKLQELEAFDMKTSSWLKTPEKIRKLGGAIFGDRRYDEVFIYHNGAESYYAARGFRGILTL